MPQGAPRFLQNQKPVNPWFIFFWKFKKCIYKAFLCIFFVAFCGEWHFGTSEVVYYCILFLLLNQVNQVILLIRLLIFVPIQPGMAMTWHLLLDRTWSYMTWHGMAWHDMTCYDSTWHDIKWHAMGILGIQYIQYLKAVMAWHDMTWHDMLWLDMTCHDMT